MEKNSHQDQFDENDNEIKKLLSIKGGLIQNHSKNGNVPKFQNDKMLASLSKKEKKSKIQIAISETNGGVIWQKIFKSVPTPITLKAVVIQNLFN